MTHKILISDKISPAAIKIFEDRGFDVTYLPDLGKDAEAFKAAIADYDGLAIRSATTVTAEVLANAPKLKVMGRAGIGVDNIDIPAATASGKVVMNTPFGNAVTTAEHAIAMMFACARQIPQASASTHAGKWEKSKFMGTELFTKTLGVIGCGNIGSLVAERGLGLKMKVIAFDPFLTPERAVELGVEKVELDELLPRADFITLHTPKTPQTANILSRENIAKTKRGVRIINCARGGLLDEVALKDALDDGHVAAAALDVYAVEPAKENVLFGHPNVVCTPHLGAATSEAQENVALQVATQISDYLQYGAVTNALNMPSISAEEAPRLKPFMGLAENLGALAGQLTEDSLEKIEITFSGDVASLNFKPLSSAIIASILQPHLSGVNQVNAKKLAEDRGIQVKESTVTELENYDSTISILIKTANGDRHFSGAIFGGEPRVIEIRNIELESPFAPHMLYVRNLDKPGFIGKLGMILADAGINIATFNLGRDTAGGEAVVLAALDDILPNEIVTQINKIDQVQVVKPLVF